MRALSAVAELLVSFLSAPYNVSKIDKMLSYRRETALQGSL